MCCVSKRKTGSRSAAYTGTWFGKKAGGWIPQQRNGPAVSCAGLAARWKTSRIQRLSTSPVPTRRKIYAWRMELKNNGITYREALEHCVISIKTWEKVGKRAYGWFYKHIEKITRNRKIANKIGHFMTSL